MGAQHLAAAFAPTRPALICYLPAGDPCFDTERLFRLYQDCGVDIVEVGVPSTDPYLDGRIVADSMRRAHAAGEARESLAFLRGVALTSRPAVAWMCYPDTDVAGFVEFVAAGAIDGVMMVDRHRRRDATPIGESLRDSDVATCAFVRAGCPDDDLAGLSDVDGYVMLQARTGPTGTGVPSLTQIGSDLEALRRRTPLPAVVGFGIQDAATARRAIEADPDGIVVGSACIQAARAGAAPLRSLLTTLRQVLDD